MFCRLLTLSLVFVLSLPIARGRAENPSSEPASSSRTERLSQRIEQMRAQTAMYETIVGEPETIHLTAGIFDNQGSSETSQTKSSDRSSRESQFESSRRTVQLPEKEPQQISRSQPQGDRSNLNRSNSTRGYRSPRSNSSAERGSVTLQDRLDDFRKSFNVPKTSRSSSSAHRTTATRYTGRTGSRPPQKLTTAPRYVPKKTAPARQDVSPRVARTLVKTVESSNTAATKSEHQVPIDGVLIDLPGPQLSAAASGPSRVVINVPATYKVMIRNTGKVVADDVIISVQIPAWVEIVNTDSTRGTAKVQDDGQQTRHVEWHLHRLAADSRERLTLEVISRESKPINLSVRWNYGHAGSSALVVVEEPLLNMIISGPNEAIYGETKLYSLTLSNPGTGIAKNVVITLLPIGGSNEGKVTHPVGDLKRGETKTIQVELDAGKAGNLVVNASAIAEGGLKVEATKEVLVRRADLKIDIQASRAQYAGKQGVYRIRVANPGNATAKEVVVDALLPNGAEFVSGSLGAKSLGEEGTVQWRLGALEPGAERTLEMVCVLTDPGANKLRVKAKEATNLVADASATTRVIARADLKLLASDPGGPVPVGEPAEYEIRIVNRGTKNAENVEAIVYFSEGVEPVSVQGGAHEITPGQILFRAIPSLAAGDELVFRIQAQASRPGDHVFRVEVVCRSVGTKLATEDTTHFYDANLAIIDSATDEPSETREPQALRRASEGVTR